MLNKGYFDWTISICIIMQILVGAVAQNRTADLLITKHVCKLTVVINQSLARLATAKTNVTQPQLVVFQPQSDTNLAQSILRPF